MAVMRRDVLATTECPRCGAQPGERCRGARDRQDALHIERWEAAGINPLDKRRRDRR